MPPRYSFVLNSFPKEKFTRCPRCEAPTRLRKLSLVIHVEHPAGPRLVMLGKTCRLCVACEMLKERASRHGQRSDHGQAELEHSCELGPGFGDVD